MAGITQRGSGFPNSLLPIVCIESTIRIPPRNDAVLCTAWRTGLRLPKQNDGKGGDTARLYVIIEVKQSSVCPKIHGFLVYLITGLREPFVDTNEGGCASLFKSTGWWFLPVTDDRNAI